MSRLRTTYTSRRCAVESEKPLKGEWTLVRNSMIAVMLFLVVAVAAPAVAEQSTPIVQPNSFRIGAGAGIPYGGIGVNGEYRVNPYSSLSAGLGYVKHDGPGWALGAMLYPLKNNRTFNPRLSGFVGRTATLERTDAFNRKSFEAINGGTLGGGLEWRIDKKLSFDFDIFYVFRDLPQGARKKDGSDVGLSTGLGLLF